MRRNGGCRWAARVGFLDVRKRRRDNAPFVYTAKKYAETKDASLIWEGHKTRGQIGYCHVGKLHNLEQLPSTGLTVSCFPVKIERASAGRTRAVAIIN